MWKASLREAVTLVALVAAGASTLAGIRAVREAREVLAGMEPGAERTYVHDRLIGSLVDIAALAPGEPWQAQATGHETLLWILDLDRCPDCFANVGPWTRLERLADAELVLLLIGDVSSLVKVRLRTLGRTRVMRTTREHVTDNLGLVRPSTKILVDAEGVAILVDSRASAKECAWTFEAQLGALKGLNAAREIRDALPASP